LLTTNSFLVNGSKALISAAPISPISILPISLKKAFSFFILADLLTENSKVHAKKAR